MGMEYKETKRSAMNTQEKFKNIVINRLKENYDYEISNIEDAIYIKYKKKLSETSEMVDKQWYNLAIFDKCFVSEYIVDHEKIKDNQEDLLEIVSTLNHFLRIDNGFYLLDEESIWFRSSQILIDDETYMKNRAEEVFPSEQSVYIEREVWPVVMDVINCEIDVISGIKKLLDERVDDFTGASFQK